MRGICFFASVLLAVPGVAQVGIAGPDAAACAKGSTEDALLLTIDGLKNRKGTIRVELWPGVEGDFLRDHHELVAEGKTYSRVMVSPPASGPAKVCIRLPGPGTYAVGAFHSPAGVRKFNFRDDGVTFTRNPKVGLSKPKAKDVAVVYGRGLSEESVTLSYLRGLSMRPIPKEELRMAGQQ